ncbi:mannose-1-phosphate guanylyltransferase/mannose-6-phosphate isomerase [Methylohalomonas lacus]|uniref:mannose-1-phosphate guanylyltransferase n=1 Tax=Methylohalomonas lacus TaxID=398773 RepID=A0AAE3HL76_9GAMM|nr:mannose-1-phosphate guanylyltransferase/mannose-6-phosphate isomerase [Methylohalomonas lacus]MCS3904395.1 mannose-1-phosphate guanylyltransferase/mannose-6-phosphate isomerase [Methylohalomonas lacus]
MSDSILPVILCGGSGTRLWPLSRESFPKQFVPLIEGKSLLQLTLERVKPLSGSAVCITNNEHRFLVQESMEAAGIDGRQFLEPAGRNTAAAMTVAALNSAADDLLLFLPADHHIPDVDAFARTVASGVPAATDGYFVTFGVQPTYPSSAYGYIQSGETLDSAASWVAQFVEKPTAEKAQQMLLAGGYFWNAGIFLVRAATLLDAVKKHAEDIFTACEQAVAQQTEDGSFVRLGGPAFLDCRSESIDYAVLEHHDRVAVVPFAGAWSDVGSWNAVAELSPADDHNNRVSGQGHTVNASNTYINAPHRPVVALGTDNLLIIDTPDALLVADTRQAEQVKQVVQLLNEQASPQAVMHRRVARPWGWYDSIDAEANFQVKRIMVKPGAKLSLQLHHHRAEHWVVVKGTARVTNGDAVFDLHENQSTYIPIGTQHRLENITDQPLEIIEVQSGDYLGEDDIVRLDDTYGRAN